MSRLNMQDALAKNIKFMSKFRFGVLSQTLSGTFALDADTPQLLFLDPGGAGREVNLPPEADCEGMVIIIVNEADGVENITVEDDASAALTPAAVVGQNEIGVFFCDGTRWQGFTGVA